EPGAGGGNKGLPRELGRLKELGAPGRTAPASLGPGSRTAFGWVPQAAPRLGNEEGPRARGLTHRWSGLLGAMAPQGPQRGQLRAAVAHFRKGTRSYGPGLFHGYAVADRPRTNKDLEQFFGSHRYPERRARGRKGASPALVLRGAARGVAAAATRPRGS